MNGRCKRIYWCLCVGCKKQREIRNYTKVLALKHLDEWRCPVLIGGRFRRVTVRVQFQTCETEFPIFVYMDVQVGK